MAGGFMTQNAINAENVLMEWCHHDLDVLKAIISYMLFGVIFFFRKPLTLKHRETHRCIVSTVATDALVLKHQAISILSTD